MGNYLKKTKANLELKHKHQELLRLVELNTRLIDHEMFKKTDITDDLMDDYIIIQIPNVNSITLKDVNKFILLMQSKETNNFFEFIYFKNNHVEYSFSDGQLLKKFMEENLPEIKNFYIFKTLTNCPSTCIIFMLFFEFENNIIIKKSKENLEEKRYLRFKYDNEEFEYYKYIFICSVE